LNIECAEKLLPLYITDKRYISIEGGRGSSKSWGVADFLLIKGLERKTRNLCAREIQNSIKDSVHKLLSDRIETHGLSGFYTITEKSIIGNNGTEFMFKGLYRNINDIKSTEGIDYLWIEEAHSVSRESLKVAVPTIRKEGSQIIFTYNWTGPDDPVHVDYVLTERPDVLHINMNYFDNPWFPTVLQHEMEYDRRTDPDKYAHVWEGKPVRHSDAQVFKDKWIIEDFEKRNEKEEIIFPPKETFFYFGADFGFSPDPATAIRCFVHNKRLYIDYDYKKLKLEITDMPRAYKEAIPEIINYPCGCDSSRNDTISHLRNNGMPKVYSVDKGKGAYIEEGIEHIRGYEKVVIHPRCKHTIDEFRLYSHVVDKHTGLISNKIEDKHNHCIDALRYALNKLIKSRGVRISTGDDINFL
jgi:phage terminase large subunit